MLYRIWGFNTSEKARSACIIYIYILYCTYKSTYKNNTICVWIEFDIKCISICLPQHCWSVCRKLGNNIYNRDCVLGYWDGFFIYIYILLAFIFFFEPRASYEFYSVITTLKSRRNTAITDELKFRYYTLRIRKFSNENISFSEISYTQNDRTHLSAFGSISNYSV